MPEVTAGEREPDELASLEVYSTVWPHDAVTIEAVHAYRDSAVDYVGYLVREDGVIVGSGVGAVVGFAKLSLTPPTAGHAVTAVRRAWRGRGIAVP